MVVALPRNSFLLSGDGTKTNGVTLPGEFTSADECLSGIKVIQKYLGYQKVLLDPR